MRFGRFGRIPPGANGSGGSRGVDFVFCYRFNIYPVIYIYINIYIYILIYTYIAEYISYILTYIFFGIVLCYIFGMFLLYLWAPAAEGSGVARAVRAGSARTVSAWRADEAWGRRGMEEAGAQKYSKSIANI